jgi:hypothetical protein
MEAPLRWLGNLQQPSLLSLPDLTRHSSATLSLQERGKRKEDISSRERR